MLSDYNWIKSTKKKMVAIRATQVVDVALWVLNNDMLKLKMFIKLTFKF